jgi:tetratricopeptide (TPR) repeat protein
MVALMSNRRWIVNSIAAPGARSRDRVGGAAPRSIGSRSLDPRPTPKILRANPRLESSVTDSKQSIEVGSDSAFSRVSPIGVFRTCAPHPLSFPCSRRAGCQLSPRRNSRPQAGYSREVVLLGALLLVLLLTVFTAFASRMYHKTFHVLADQWFAQGDVSFHAGNAAEALNDYRNALVYSPNNPQFQFHLAQALAATGREEEAESYLVNLLSVSPGSGEINLELARSSARRKTGMAAALRYYHAAIYGEWDHDPLIMRWDVRRELCEYLLAHGTRNQTEPELIAMVDNVPVTDIPRQKIAAELLLRGQLWDRALTAFRSALSADPRDPDALAGAGAAAFHLIEFPQTVEYLSALPKDKLANAQIAGMLETSRQVIAYDPFLSGLSVAEKAARTARVLASAESRAEQCANQPADHGITRPADGTTDSDLQKLIAQSATMKTAWSERMLVRFPDRIDEAMALAFQLETASEVCGPAQGPDLAIALLTQTRVGRNQ